MLHWSFTSCRFSYLLLAWIAIPFCFESNYLLRIWLKNVPEWTVIFIRLQLIRTLLEQLSLGMNTALNAQNKIKKLNIQSTYLFFIAVIVICLLFYLGYPPYMLFIVMIALVIVQTLLKLQLCHKYIGMGYIPISMKTDFLQIYNSNIKKAPEQYKHDDSNQQSGATGIRELKKVA